MVKYHAVNQLAVWSKRIFLQTAVMTDSNDYVNLPTLKRKTPDANTKGAAAQSVLTSSRIY
jgi:hypothetical protein